MFYLLSKAADKMKRNCVLPATHGVGTKSRTVSCGFVSCVDCFGEAPERLSQVESPDGSNGAKPDYRHQSITLVVTNSFFSCWLGLCKVRLCLNMAILIQRKMY